MLTVLCLTQVILQADKTSNNFSDRAILKNLGHWLGLQTLGKNKPILQKVGIVSAHHIAVCALCSAPLRTWL